MNDQSVSLCDLAPAHIREILPYVPGKPIEETARELGLDPAKIVKLASNENPLGSSPKALEAIRAALDTLNFYPDGNGFELKKVISRRFKVAPEQVILGNGSNDVLELVARTFLTDRDSAVYSKHAFMVYPLVVQAVGARGIEVPSRGYSNDLGAMAAAVEGNTKVVFLANPNNPTGTFEPWSEVKRFIESIPKRVIVVIDEAYGEYLPAELRAETLPWIERHPNLIVSRTLSKAYGLAGLRVGFGIGNPELIALMNRVRQPFNVNQLALAAAGAALEDFAFLEKSFQVNRDGLAQLTEGFKRLGLEWIPSFGNFVCVKLADAPRAYQFLLKRGIIVRPIAGYGMPEFLRVTVGLAGQNAAFLAGLEAALASP
jgi:histidinol-phosphate aminotransferase